MAAARELFEVGLRTTRPGSSGWTPGVVATGGTTSTSTKLEQLSDQVLDEYGYALRRMRPS